MAESPVVNPPTGLPARKHLAYLSQFLLGVFLTALFFQLRVAEARVQREDFESMVAVGSLTELPPHDVFIQEANRTRPLGPTAPQSDGASPQFANEFDKAVQGAVHSWLKANHPDLDQSHRQARDAVVGWLQASGLAVEDARALSGKGYGDRTPFLFFRTGVRPLHSRFGTEAGVSKNPPVGLLLDEVQHLAAPTTLVVVQSVKAADFPRPDIRLHQRGPESARGDDDIRPKEYELESATLDDGNHLVVTFVETRGYISLQGVADRKRYSIPVATQVVPAPSLLEIVSPGLHSNRLTAIAHDPARQSQLYETYGALRLDSARTMTGNRMLDSFHDVEILGFKFSPRYFWVFTFAFLASALVAIAVHLKGGRPADEATAFGLDVLTDRMAFRVAFWWMIPPAALFLARPQNTASWWILVAYWVAFASLIVGGAWLVLLSARILQGNGSQAGEPPQATVDEKQAAPTAGECPAATVPVLAGAANGPMEFPRIVGSGKAV